MVPGDGALLAAAMVRNTFDTIRSARDVARARPCARQHPGRRKSADGQVIARGPLCPTAGGEVQRATAASTDARELRVLDALTAAPQSLDDDHGSTRGGWRHRPQPRPGHRRSRRHTPQSAALIATAAPGGGWEFKTRELMQIRAYSRRASCERRGREHPRRGRNDRSGALHRRDGTRQWQTP